MKILVSVVAILILMFCVGCTAPPEVIDGMAYAKYPKADILARAEVERAHHILVVCDSEGWAHVLYIHDSTVIGSGSAWVGNDLKVSLPCGARLPKLNQSVESQSQTP